MLRYIKYALIVFLIVFLFLISRGDNVKDVPVGDIDTKVASAAGISALTKGDAKALRRYYGLEEADVLEYVIYVPSSQMSVDECSIFKAKDKAGAEKIKNAVEGRVKTQKKSFEGYGVEQTGLLNQAIIQTKGTYVFLGVSKDAKLWETTFLECIQ